MRFALSCLVGSLLLFTAASSLAQDHPTPTGHAASGVMGFDQARTQHHFLLYDDGGAIEVVVKDPSDRTNLAAIRAHLPHIAMMFSDGDFVAPMLVHDSKDVPGTRVMSTRKEAIRYAYAETPNGGRVDIVTRDPEALAAVHAFLRYQISEHQTGDPTTASKRR